MSTPPFGFQGARLREAREARALTAIALSELVGVNPTSISHYENDRHCPSEKVLNALARTLNVPIAFFQRPPRKKVRLLFWRSRHAATKQQRVRATQRHNWLLDVVDFLASHIHLPDVRLPDIKIPRDPTTISDALIEEAALATRRIWSLGEEPIADLVGTLERHGAIVTRSPLETDLLDAFSEWRQEDERPYVMLSTDKQSAVRSRFDAAHELGHMLLHRQVEMRDFKKPEIHSMLESQAMRFASALHLPAKRFTDDLYSTSLDAFRELKMRWRVAISAMIYRASDLGLITERQTKRLWINMARRKWKKREPGDDDIKPEQPQLLQRGFDLLLNEGMITTPILEAEIGLFVRDIESVAGLPDSYLSSNGGQPFRLRLTE